MKHFDSTISIHHHFYILTRFFVVVLFFACFVVPSSVFGSNLAEIYKNRGNAYYQKKQYSPAVNEFTKAIEINHDYLEAYYNRGLAYYDLNLYYKAIVDFDMVLMLNPDVREAYFSRGLAYSKVNKLKLALSDVKKAADMGDADAQAMLASGELTDRVEKEKRRQANMRTLLDDKQREYNRVVAVISINNVFGGNTVSTTHSKGDPLYDGKDGVFKSIDYFNPNDVLVKTEVLHTASFNSVNGRNKTVLWYKPDSTLLKKEFYYTGRMLSYKGVFYFDEKGNSTKKVLLDKFGKEVKK